VKTPIICTLSLIAVGLLYCGSTGGRAESLTADTAGKPGTPPIGLLVEVRLISWPLATADAGKVQGKLVAMTDQWLVVASGSDEFWLPKDKVMAMKASR